MTVPEAIIYLIIAIFIFLVITAIYFDARLSKQKKVDKSKGMFKGAIIKYHDQAIGVVKAWNDDGVFILKPGKDKGQKDTYFISYSQIDEWG